MQRFFRVPDIDASKVACLIGEEPSNKSPLDPKSEILSEP